MREMVLLDTDVAEQLDKHLNSPKQTWLLGAGISFNASIPLMYPLTKYVLELARDAWAGNILRLDGIEFLVSDCGEAAHIEHILTHLGDFISLADRSARRSVKVGETDIQRDELVGMHRDLVGWISDTVRWGYVPAVTDEAGVITQEACRGSAGASIVTIDDHLEFVEAIFAKSRAGLDFVRSPVEFFTTNYDTLIEDALALRRVPYQDGFVGGGIGYWDAFGFAANTGSRAFVTKLHGSIDWYEVSGDHGRVFRIRDGQTYPEPGGAVMIYPQATKYLNTQRSPFSTLFQRFRNRLSDGKDHVCMICGYSFGDDHIDAEIESAMSASGSQLTLIAFAYEGADGLPERLQKWLADARFGDRVFVASQSGLYQGKNGPFFPATPQRNWWSFVGVTDLIASGLPKDIREAL